MSQLRASAAPTLDMVGKKYGHLVVLKVAGRRHYPSQSVPVVLVRCDCGLVYEAQAQHIRNATSACRACAMAAVADKNRIRLSNGKTLADIARKSGVALCTVQSRLQAGWAEKDLGLPSRGEGWKDSRGRTIRQLAALAGCSVQAIKQRIGAGWPEKDLDLPAGSRRAEDTSNPKRRARSKS